MNKCHKVTCEKYNTKQPNLCMGYINVNECNDSIVLNKTSCSLQQDIDLHPLTENQELYLQAFEKWGELLQLDVLQEECAELIVSISKIKRQGWDATYKNFIEEMIDVEIMLEQFKTMMLKQKPLFDEMKRKKLKRLDTLVNRKR